jgi:hypothetical protein
MQHVKYYLLYILTITFPVRKREGKILNQIAEIIAMMMEAESTSETSVIL